MRYTLSRATSAVAMLRRHGRVPTDDEIREAYRDLAAAHVEACIAKVDRRGLPLDAERARYLVDLILSHSEEAASPVTCGASS